MSIIDFTVAGGLAAAALAMSKMGLTVPKGFEALHYISAVAMAAGYVAGKEIHSRIPWKSVVALSIVSVVCCVSYYIAISYASPGLSATLLLSILTYLIFFPFALILAVARQRE